MAKGSSPPADTVSAIRNRRLPPSTSDDADTLTDDVDEAKGTTEETIISLETTEKEKPTSQQLFLGWLDEAMTHPISVKLHTNPKTKQLSKVSLLGVPSSLKNEGGLELWTQKGWLKVSSQEIGLVGESLGLLGKKRLERLKALCRAQPADTSPVRATSPSPICPEDNRKLKRYIQSVGHLLLGHPLREQVESEDALDAIGLYQPCTVLLEKDLVEKLLGAIPDALNTRKAGASGDQRWVVEIPLEQLEHHSKLIAWCKANWHRLKGHPAYEA